MWDKINYLTLYDYMYCVYLLMDNSKKKKNRIGILIPLKSLVAIL